jgi:hypothetical protein
MSKDEKYGSWEITLRKRYCLTPCIFIENVVRIPMLSAETGGCPFYDIDSRTAWPSFLAIGAGSTERAPAVLKLYVWNLQGRRIAAQADQGDTAQTATARSANGIGATARLV